MSRHLRSVALSLLALATVVLGACAGSTAPGASMAAETSSVGLRSVARFHLGGASSSPLDALALGMRLEDAWERAPALRDAFYVEMESSAYEALRRRVPGLGESQEGGNRHWKTRSRSGRWLIVNGVAYELRFDHAALLRSIHLRLPDARARDAAVAGWGQPAIDERWRVWLDEATGTQAAATECSKDDVPSGCMIEIMPFQAVAKSVTAIFPDAATLVGRTEESLPFGAGIHWDFVRYYLVPLAAGLWQPLEVQLDTTAPRRVVAYRTVFEYVYAQSARASILAALRAAVPDLAPIESPRAAGSCWAGSRSGARVEVCEHHAQLLVTVGNWTL